MKRVSYISKFVVVLVVSLLVGLAGCQGKAAGGISSQSLAGRSIALTAIFKNKDGKPLAKTGVRLTKKDQTVLFTTDANGTLVIADFPTDVSVLLAVMDATGKTQSEAQIQCAAAAVTDAYTDENGTVQVSIADNCTKMTLVFTLDETGKMNCSLQPQNATT